MDDSTQHGNGTGSTDASDLLLGHFLEAARERFQITRTIHSVQLIKVGIVLAASAAILPTLLVEFGKRFVSFQLFLSDYPFLALALLFLVLSILCAVVVSWPHKIDECPSFPKVIDMLDKGEALDRNLLAALLQDQSDAIDTNAKRTRILVWAAALSTIFAVASMIGLMVHVALKGLASAS